MAFKSWNLVFTLLLLVLIIERKPPGVFLSSEVVIIEVYI